MYKVKIILICILSIGFIGIANAQGGRLQKQSAPKKNTVITCEVKKNTSAIIKELKKDVLKNEITKDNTVKIVANDSAQSVSLSFDTTKIDLANIAKRLTDKSYILLIPEPVKEKVVEAEPALPAEKYNPEIDRFLNREDVSVFKENFTDLQDSQIHPRSRSYYQLLKNIRTLDSMLTNTNLSSADLDIMGKLIDEINDPAKSPKNLLPTPLLNYYRSLVKKYGEIYDNIYQ